MIGTNEIRRLRSRNLCKSVFHLWLLCLLLSAQSLFAETQESSSEDNDRDSLVRATRTMQKVDKDGNGTFEKSEDAELWKRYRKLDANRDGVLSIEELRKTPPSYIETGGERKLEVVYKSVEGRDLKLDLYYPTANRPEKCPVVVFTHGGGWAAGNRYKAASGSFDVVFKRLVKEGFAVAPVTYRLAKKDSNVAMRDCVIDCKDAIRYLAKNSEELRIDPMRICVMGDSAGGHIAQMLLLASPEQLPGDKDLASVSYSMLAGVSWYGPCDFERTDLFNHDDRADFRDRFGPRILGSDTGPSVKMERYREVSSVNYLSENSPPLLMIQGDKDTTIPVKHAYYMKQKADAVKAPVEVMIIKNAGHNWRKVESDIEPSRDEIIERTVQFFVERL
jgi:acetyl esterase/lipase